MAVFVENATKLAMARDEARKAASEAIREGLKAVAEMRTRAEAAEARATAAEAQVARMQEVLIMLTDVLVTVETNAVEYPRLYKKAAAAVKAILALNQDTHHETR